VKVPNVLWQEVAQSHQPVSRQATQHDLGADGTAGVAEQDDPLRDRADAVRRITHARLLRSRASSSSISRSKARSASLAFFASRRCCLMALMRALPLRRSMGLGDGQSFAQWYTIPSH
jgi:hypothetical protein